MAFGGETGLSASWWDIVTVPVKKSGVWEHEHKAESSAGDCWFWWQVLISAISSMGGAPRVGLNIGVSWGGRLDSGRWSVHIGSVL